MSKLKILIDEKTLLEKIDKIANEINKDYQSDRDLVVICVLKGAVYFFTDLTKRIKKDTILEFMKISSYVGTESSGEISIKTDLSLDIENKDVLIVEDILDTGLTLVKLKEYLKTKNPNSIKIAVLLDKKARRTENIVPEYACFEIEDKFVVGYGLDYDEKYRNLPYVGYLE